MLFSSHRFLQTLHVRSGVRLGALENILKGAAIHHTSVPFGDYSLTGSRFVKGKLSEVKVEDYFPQWKLLNMEKGRRRIRATHTKKNSLGK